MNDEPKIMEYSPRPVVGSVEVRVTTEGTTIVVRSTLRKVWPVLTGPLIIFAFGMGLFSLFILMVSNSDFHWGMLTFPGIFCGLGMVAGFANLWPKLFPITFEGNPEYLTCRWRTLTEAKVFKMPRQSIQYIRAAKIRQQGHPFKKWSLVLRLTTGGEMVIYRAKHAEVEVIALHLRNAMRLREKCDGAMGIVSPPGCRYQRLLWADGIAIVIPPRGEKRLTILTAIGSAAIAVGCYFGVRFLTDGQFIHPNALSRIAGTLTLAVAVGGGLFYVIYQLFRKIRKRTTLVATPSHFAAAETGFVRPLNIDWKAAAVREIAAAEAGEGRGRLRITPKVGETLEIAEGERMEDLRWAAQVMLAAMSPSTIHIEVRSESNPL